MLLRGQPERAARLYAWADALREADQILRPPAEQDDIDRDFTAIRTQLDEATIGAAQTAGRAMTLEQAVAEALAMTTAMAAAAQRG